MSKVHGEAVVVGRRVESGCLTHMLIDVALQSPIRSDVAPAWPVGQGRHRHSQGHHRDNCSHGNQLKDTPHKRPSFVEGGTRQPSLKLTNECTLARVCYLAHHANAVFLATFL